MKRSLLAGPKDNDAPSGRRKQAATLHTTCNSDFRFR